MGAAKPPKKIKHNQKKTKQIVKMIIMEKICRAIKNTAKKIYRTQALSPAKKFRNNTVDQNQKKINVSKPKKKQNDHEKQSKKSQLKDNKATNTVDVHISAEK